MVEATIAEIIKANKEDIANELKQKIRNEKDAKFVALFIAGGIYDECTTYEYYSFEDIWLEGQEDIHHVVLDLGRFTPKETHVKVVDMDPYKRKVILLEITNPDIEPYRVDIYPVEEELLNRKEQKLFKKVYGQLLAELWGVKREHDKERHMEDYDEYVFNVGGREYVVISSWNGEIGEFCLSVIIEGVVDFEEFYKTKRQAREILENMKERYPELRNELENLFG